MSNIEVEVVLARIQAIRKYLERLQEFESLTLQEYINDFDTQLIVERLIQLLTEASLDINKYLLTQLGILPSRDNWKNKEYFLEAAKQKILTEELAQKLAQAVGMRNILVHRYLDINLEIVFGAIHECLTYYPIYLRQITNYLDSLETEND
ncbi:MAG: DUF86 domain-containing protein [Oscillatoria sp. PMC 1068.18]|nr:DUF86 domain-containing protein [Oscillatoria sp. PMC 1076.18]MEC4987331.1 DUF86 domain-containing protein [Oscillatoria sp. PMC 1068.18]